MSSWTQEINEIANDIPQEVLSDPEEGASGSAVTVPSDDPSDDEGEDQCWPINIYVLGKSHKNPIILYG